MGVIYNKKHGYAGKTKERLYNTWLNIKQRCLNSNNPKYHIYGGKGVSIYSEWKDDFIKFKDWALSNGYSDNLTIDRIDVDGNYEPSNCRWITNKEQQNNRSNNVFIEYKGMTKTLQEWSDDLGFCYKTLQKRLNHGWGAERAFSTPPISSIRDLTGKRFGKLIVISFDHSNKYAYWLCECDCGNEKVIRGSNLTEGLVKSCGCLRGKKWKGCEI